eukprot:scaffold2824_cov372-Prasinococcus_capsulatus_cf.AAC.12
MAPSGGRREEESSRRARDRAPVQWVTCLSTPSSRLVSSRDETPHHPPAARRCQRACAAGPKHPPPTRASRPSSLRRTDGWVDAADNA